MKNDPCSSLPIQVEFLDELAQQMISTHSFDPKAFSQGAQALVIKQGIEATSEQTEAAINRIITRHYKPAHPQLIITPGLSWGRPKTAKGKATRVQRLNRLVHHAYTINLDRYLFILFVSPLAGGAVTLLTAAGWAMLRGSLTVKIFTPITIALGLATCVVGWVWGLKARRQSLRAQRIRTELLPEMLKLMDIAPDEEKLEQWSSIPAIAEYARGCIQSEVGLLAGDVEALDVAFRNERSAQAIVQNKERIQQKVEAFLSH